MDILHLIDRLETIIQEGRPVPLARLIMVDEDRIMELIDQMRVSIPEEVKKAQKMMADQARQVAHAQEEAERIRKLAQEEREQIVDQEEVVKSAKIRSDRIIEHAKQEAEVVRADADDYVIETLESLELELQRTLQQAQNGIHKLKADRGMLDIPPAE